MDGGAPVKRITTGLEFILSDPNVMVLFINILGGITRCYDVARGILQAKAALKSRVSIVVRLVGTNEEEGKGSLNEAGIQVLGSI